MPISLDIETMSIQPTAAITAIGMVQFDFERGPAAEFYLPVHLATSVREGGHLDPATVLWWLQQPLETIRKMTFNAVDVVDALTMANEWIKTSDETLIYARGSLDTWAMQTAMERIGIVPAWHYTSVRDVRSIASLYPSIEREPFVGIPHFARDDAWNDARHVCKIWRTLNGKAA